MIGDGTQPAWRDVFALPERSWIRWSRLRPTNDLERPNAVTMPIQDMETAPSAMPYRVEIGSRADAQLDELDPVIGASVERKIPWLAKNAALMVHRRLVGMPSELADLCKLRVGDYRILYWDQPV